MSVQKDLLSAWLQFLSKKQRQEISRQVVEERKPLEAKHESAGLVVSYAKYMEINVMYCM